MNQQEEDFFKDCFNLTHDSSDNCIKEELNQTKELFHYSDVAGLMGIVSSHSVRVSNTLFMNDPNEFHYPYKMMQEALEELSGTIKHEEFRKAISDMSNEILHDKFPKNDDVFICSLSENKDQLSQWRAYGDNGMGVSIGFDAPQLIRTNRPAPYWGGFIRKVIYEKDKQIAEIVSLVSQLDCFLQKKQYPRIDYDYLHLSLSSALHMIHPLFKHKGYSEEAEWRIIGHSSWLLKAHKPTVIKYRQSQKSIIPYIDFKLAANANKCKVANVTQPLSRIVCGPKFHSRTYLKSIIPFMNNHGYNIPVERSSISYE